MRSVRPGFFIKAIVLSLIVIGLSGHLIDRLFFSYQEEDDVNFQKAQFESVLILMRELMVTQGQEVLQNQLKEIQTAFSVGIEIMPASSIYIDGMKIDELDGLIISDEQDRHFMYRRIDSNYIAQIGPLPDQPDSNRHDMLISLAFYILILIVFIYWLSPFIKNLDKLSTAAENFMKDGKFNILDIDERSPIFPLTLTFNKLVDTIDDMLKYQSDMFRTVSHELRTPLSRIKFSLELINRKPLAVEDKDYLSQIDKDIKNLESLIDQILRYSKIEYNKEALHTSQVNVIEFIKDIETEFKPVAEQYKMIFELDNIPLSARICVDVGLMRIALSNLLQNAIRYGDNQIMLQASCDKAYLYITVQDNGDGLSNKEDYMLYKPFAISKTHRDGSKSYGLGLAITKRILELHQGSLAHGRSAKLGGAEFKIKLPLEIGLI